MPKKSAHFDSVVIMHSQSPSYGDAMRMIDSKGIITGDFLVCYADTVSNIDIGPILTKHRERRKASKDAIMTVVTRDVGRGPHRSKPTVVEPVFFVNPTKERILHYEEITPFSVAKLETPYDVATEQCFDIYGNLLDTGIDICTPEVLALWTESFDADKPRSHFLHNILKDYELNGKTIHIEILQDRYAARVSTLQYYNIVSQDILRGYVKPFSPDTNLGDNSKYTRFHRLYKEDGVILARSCEIQGDSVLGRATTVGERTVLKNCVVGRNCKIGNNVRLENAYLWDNVTIEDGVTSDLCIIADGATIKTNAKIGRGAVISYKVVVGSDVEVPSNRRITCAARKDEHEGEFTSVPSQSAVVGSDGSGYLYEEENEAENDPARDLLNTLVYDISSLKLPEFDDCSALGSESEDDETELGQRSRLSSFASQAESISSAEGGDSSFYKDAVADITRTLSTKGDFNNMRVEFTSLRLSNNASDAQIQRAIAAAFNKHIMALISGGTGAEMAVATALVNKDARSFISEVGVGADKNEVSQIDYLLAVQRDLAHREKGAIVIETLFGLFSSQDMIDDDAFIAWWNSPKSMDSDELKAIREAAEDFITEIEEGESESEEESSEEEDSDDE